MNEVSKNQKNEIILAIRKARSETTDLMELAVGASDQWPTYRARILRIYGDRGLEAVVRGILEDETNDEGSHE